VKRFGKMLPLPAISFPKPTDPPRRGYILLENTPGKAPGFVSGDTENGCAFRARFGRAAGKSLTKTRVFERAARFFARAAALFERAGFWAEEASEPTGKFEPRISDPMRL
jgi:hypothetical protein